MVLINSHVLLVTTWLDVYLPKDKSVSPEQREVPSRRSISEKIYGVPWVGIPKTLQGSEETGKMKRTGHVEGGKGPGRCDRTNIRPRGKKPEVRRHQKKIGFSPT